MSNSQNLLVINTGLGNTGSLVNALTHLNFKCSLVSNYNDRNINIECYQGFVLPGVGSFSAGIKNIRKNQLDKLINVLVKKKIPGLGICLGMQMMVESSEEGDGLSKGLGLFKGKVIKLPSKHEPVPHIGWTKTFSNKQTDFLFDLLNKDFYYVHSYAVDLKSPEEIAATFKHGRSDYISAIYKPNLLGVQFHPEKSQESGLELIREFFKSP